jgi:hypothetical protein
MAVPLKRQLGLEAVGQLGPALDAAVDDRLIADASPPSLNAPSSTLGG